MSINIDNNVKNQGQAPAMLTGLDANKPSPGQPGRLFYATDTNIIYIDNGTTWDIFIESSSGPSITVNPNYLPKADPSGNLVNSALYENVTTGDIVWGDTDTQYGEFSLVKDTNRVRFSAVNKSIIGDDKTADFRFIGYGGAILELIANVYATNANHVNTNSFPNSLNIKAKKTNGKIVFIVGGDTSANIKGFINNNGNFIINNLTDFNIAKLQVTGNIYTDLFRGPLFTNGTDKNINVTGDQIILTDELNDNNLSINPNAISILNNENITQSDLSSSQLKIYNGDINTRTTINSDNILCDNLDGLTTNIYPGSVTLSEYGSDFFSTSIVNTKIKALDLGTYSTFPMISMGWSLGMGSKTNRGLITYIGGSLISGSSVTCTLTLSGYTTAPYTILQLAGSALNQQVQLQVLTATFGSVTIRVTNTDPFTIGSGVISFNYINIL